MSRILKMEKPKPAKTELQKFLDANSEDIVYSQVSGEHVIIELKQGKSKDFTALKQELQGKGFNLKEES